jgi:hypothetical protein
MNQHRACAMYDQIEEALTPVTMQLRSVIQADTNVAARASERVECPAQLLSPSHRDDLFMNPLDELGINALSFLSADAVQRQTAGIQGCRWARRRPARS